MILLGADFETTGLVHATDRITEIGAVLWNTEGGGSPVKIMNRLIFCENMPELSPEIIKLTGLTNETLKRYGVPPKQAFDELSELICEADFVVAHNGNGFDRPFAQFEFRRHLGHDIPEVEWIDTTLDVDYPSTITTRKLVHLAAEHGFLNPFAHRAVFDVLTMLKVLQQYDMDQVVKWAKAKSVQVKAKVSFDDREKAKARGYRWQPETKSWLKNLKEFQLESERKSAPFEIEVVG